MGLKLWLFCLGSQGLAPSYSYIYRILPMGLELRLFWLSSQSLAPAYSLHVESETNSVPLMSKLIYLRPNGIKNVTVTNIKREILLYGIFYTYF